MKYELVYTRRAEKDITKLEPVIKNRVGKTLLRFSKEPLTFAEKLIDSSLGTYRFRRGDYRVVFDISGNQIVVLRVGHRREIYKRK
ncbi:MAG: type II toxin-antitoxin system RelE/ParE family toxin [Nitrospiraceae bacterium]|nr:type II toxin-antitoxin system RelE/ParE family toxin [Nitrospiraceae bacterium]